ncbi:efflux RND transporter permease subunit [Microcoleus sp. CAWBG640]|uniref:efflux RND transporter permease subunit n=1 Tax=Microcoleus sp. CAWBG640 TaxID=2841653 RepID=UPI00312BBBBB
MKMRRYNLSLYIAGGIVLVITSLILKPFALVGAGERGVIMRFGKVQDAILDEGIHPILPIVTSVKTLSVRVQKTDMKADAASKDLQKISTDLAVNWNIDPAKANQVFQQVGDEEQIVTSILSPAISDTIPDSIATSFQGASQVFQSSLPSLGLLLAIAVLVIYLILGILYEDFLHPITILSGLPSAGFGALLTRKMQS